MAGFSFSIGGICAKIVGKRLLCAVVNFFVDRAIDGFLEGAIGFDLFFDKNNHYIVV